ncbi:uncharacterized protein LOC111284204 [Durio zibethinus]|uniref:Uncharacterized protein LOC111284204 n=1 Tax=Durio zibethinus TaxID=66656 RepID=A0A6P5XJU0_DURZI|nr:uncharacterized protein LOC111284204 [Durio zibethinus]
MGLSGKLKRDIDQVNDDFSDFSLSSPATKIRRLDADLPPIIEEEESFPENHDKAIVLFNPLLLHNKHLLPSPSTLSLSLNSHLICGFKDQFLRGSDMKSADFDDTKTEESKKATEEYLAVVPWVPSQIPSVESIDGESKEADEMDIEESNSDNLRMEQERRYEFDGLNLSVAIHHWPQQHCMIPQPPQNQFTPITWSQ